jgi:hypothetical protein
MESLHRNVILSIVCGLLIGCADQRIDRSDEEAMMIYRDCMEGVSGKTSGSSISSVISSSDGVDKDTSIAANVQTKQEREREIECMRMAGWRE